MSNRNLIVLTFLIVLGIGGYLFHQEQETPADKVKDALEKTVDSVEDAAN